MPDPLPPFASKLPDAVIADELAPGLALRVLRPADMPLIRRWLEAPHVARWWGPLELSVQEIRGHLDHAHVAPFLIVELDRPVGYLQVYHANADEFWQDHELPRETFGLDLSIGEADAVGRGLGPAAAGLAIRRLFQWPQVRRIHIDPDPANAAAIRAYEKAGFRPACTIVTPDGPALYLTIERP